MLPKSKKARACMHTPTCTNIKAFPKFTNTGRKELEYPALSASYLIGKKECTPTPILSQLILTT